MSPLLVYAFDGMLIGLALVVASVGVDTFRRSQRRQTALKRVVTSIAEAQAPASLRRLRAEKPDGPFAAAHAAAMNLYVQSGASIRPEMLAIAGAVGGGLGFMLAQRALDNTVFSLVIAVALALFAPYLMLARAREKRRAAFVAQLPAAMDVLVRSLRAGHPLTVAISLVARDIPAPVGEEFSACSQEMAFGLDIETAIGNIARRIEVAEANVLAAAVSIQQRTGGNLTEVLARLATLLRDRAKLRAKARALSSEGRWSGLFLSALPFLMFGALSITSPNYYGGVQTNPIVAPILLITFVWMVIGIGIINRMVNFKP